MRTRGPYSPRRDCGEALTAPKEISNVTTSISDSNNLNLIGKDAGHDVDCQSCPSASSSGEVRGVAVPRSVRLSIDRRECRDVPASHGQSKLAICAACLRHRN